MIKMMIFLRRAPDLDRAGFASWWLERHRPDVLKLVGLRRTVFNLLPDEGPYDAVIEQWFDDAAAAAAAYDTPLGRALVADSSAHARDRVRLQVEEHVFDLVSPQGVAP